MRALGAARTNYHNKTNNGTMMSSSNNAAQQQELRDVSITTSSIMELQDKHGKANTSIMNLQTFKFVLLAMMVVQNSSTVLVGRYTRSSVPTDQLYAVNHLLLIIEGCKFVLSAALEAYTLGGVAPLLMSINTHVWQRPMDALKISVPAILYLIQNTLLYVALSNLTAPLFQVTYQAKLVTTALVSVLMLQRSYSAQQWICLVVLSVGVAVVVLGETGGSTSKTNSSGGQNLMVGLIAVTVACFSSALAGVYFEKVLKRTDDTSKQVPASLWMRNMQLAFFSVVIAAMQGIGQTANHANENATSKGYLHGFTFVVWILVGLQAGGGLLVAAVIKVTFVVLEKQPATQPWN
jgi:UDP-sugar transporter A1/2/3